MELSNEVSQGLGYLANGSYISDDNFKKIVTSCLGLLSGDQNIERVSTICPEKSDIIKQIYTSLLTFTIEAVRNKAEDEIQNVMGKYNFKSDRTEYFIKALKLHQENIVKSLESCESGWPSIVDCDWKLDYVIKSNTQNQSQGPLFYIILTTEKNGKLDYVKFTCNLHQLQDLSTKLREILKALVKKFKMTELWNSWDVKQPPICSVKTELHVKEMNALKDLTFNAIKTLRDGSKVLDREAAFLSRFLYKHKRIFRHDKGMQNLVKVNQCLKKYLKLDLVGVLAAFKQTFPHKLPAAATHAFLPTNQMLKWILLRLQAFSQIFARVIQLTKQTGVYIYQKLYLGWSLRLSFLVFCMTARIMAMAKFLVAKSLEWYSSFYKYLPFLKETAVFLPEYTFPPGLKKWLGPVDLTPLKKETLIDNIFEIIDLAAEDDEGDEIKIVHEKLFKMFKTTIQLDSDIEEIVEEEIIHDKKGQKRSLVSLVNEDFGVPVNDEEDVIDVPVRKKRKKGRNLNN